ncbi:MAG TPA: hypothetical protein VIY73_12705 [Polyangiaceae bacterium]
MNTTTTETNDTTTPPELPAAHLRKRLDAWHDDLRSGLVDAARDVTHVIAGNAGAIEGGEVDVDRCLASAALAITVTTDELSKFVAALGFGVVPGVGESPAAEVMGGKVPGSGTKKRGWREEESPWLHDELTKLRGHLADIRGEVQVAEKAKRDASHVDGSVLEALDVIRGIEVEYYGTEPPKRQGGAS